VKSGVRGLNQVRPMDAGGRKSQRYPSPVPSAQRPITADEYLNGAEEHFVELVGGRVVMDEPTVWHQMLCGRVYAALVSWAGAQPGRGAVLLPVNVRLDKLNVFGPDVSWVREERRPDHSARWIEPPDLVVEVRSPGTWQHDIGHKRRYYEHFGVRELWLIDGFADSVLVHRREDAAPATFALLNELRPPADLTSALLPEFVLPLAELFAR